MTTARCQQICLDVTPWYHCTTRCVRQAYICGFDQNTKKDFDHRRSWIEDRILLMTSVFCIDVGAYAVMSNHYHVVVKISRDQAMALSDAEVVKRWLTIYSGNDLAKRLNEGETLSVEETQTLDIDIRRWRSELANLSRFMAEINQNIARRANLEDGCKGRFWESRFNSQAILDYDALVRTLIYVDLNPVRAKLSRDPESSRCTSINRRLNISNDQLIPFMTTGDQSLSGSEKSIPISLEEYLALLDWTGREIRSDKRGSIPLTAPTIFHRLGYSPEQWLNTQQPKVTWRQKAIGSIQQINAYCKTVGQHWIWQASEHVIRL